MTSNRPILECIDSVGTVPTSAAQVFGLINDPKASSADFERVMRPDVGLTANMLKCANSAYYRGSREVTSVKDAISRMGLRRVFEVVAGASFAKAIPKKLIGYDVPAEKFWEQSVAVAVLADKIGREAGFTYPDLAFTSGLLHDLGKLVVSNYLAQPGVQATMVAHDGPLKSIEEERKLFDSDHTQLGEALAVKWNLPKEIAGAARWHHEPTLAPTATLRYLATVIQVADGALRVMGLGDALDKDVPLDASALERLNLEPEKVLKIVDAAKPEIEKTIQMLAAAR
jgi:putative nucleotidyltransferase with HDIG domain